MLPDTATTPLAEENDTDDNESTSSYMLSRHMVSAKVVHEFEDTTQVSDEHDAVPPCKKSKKGNGTNAEMTATKLLKSANDMLISMQGIEDQPTDESAIFGKVYV